ncbi:MAG: 16S rRNA (guanine(966)-N(2))-methyltransferase RsmD [Candidatus Dormibacteraeota bacterium]|nr:16S rRNA (guanine(966)-N(2))-methyltransferase RsmD [Candidatus Dormibacteraeota bacterium]
MRGSLQVHGGEAGGRRLVTPKGIRPTQGLIKEAIFNALDSAVPEAKVIDLFAGSGALGIEALSRGALHATFVEREDAGLDSIRKNLRMLEYSERSTVERSEVTRWLQRHSDQVREASLVLMDPPYNDPVLDRALTLLDGLLGEGATVVVERAARQSLPTFPRLRPTRERKYGDTLVSFLVAGP